MNVKSRIMNVKSRPVPSPVLLFLLLDAPCMIAAVLDLFKAAHLESYPTRTRNSQLYSRACCPGQRCEICRTSDCGTTRCSRNRSHHLFNCWADSLPWNERARSGLYSNPQDYMPKAPSKRFSFFSSSIDLSAPPVSILTRIARDQCMRQPVVSVHSPVISSSEYMWSSRTAVMCVIGSTSPPGPPKSGADSNANCNPHAPRRRANTVTCHAFRDLYDDIFRFLEVLGDFLQLDE